jgi:predicted RNase H-like nuclease (RuvC/YqgF family)
MNGQKQSRVDALEKRMAAATNVIQQLINEIERLSTMVSGHHRILKQLPGYEDAIENLKKEVAEESSKTEETKSS